MLLKSLFERTPADLVFAKLGIVWSKTMVGKGWTEDGCESPAYVVAEGETELARAMIWHEVALNTEVATSDAKANRIQFLVVC